MIFDTSFAFKPKRKTILDFASPGTIAPYFSDLSWLLGKTWTQDAVSVADRAGFPEWVEVDSKKLEGTFKAMPEREELPAEINESV